MASKGTENFNVSPDYGVLEFTINHVRMKLPSPCSAKWWRRVRLALSLGTVVLLRRSNLPGESEWGGCHLRPSGIGGGTKSPVVPSSHRAATVLPD